MFSAKSAQNGKYLEKKRFCPFFGDPFALLGLQFYRSETLPIVSGVADCVVVKFLELSDEWTKFIFKNRCPRIANSHHRFRDAWAPKRHPTECSGFEISEFTPQ